MKLLMLGDCHFGARGDSLAFHEMFDRFFNETLFPYMEENGIDTIFQVGDIFDRRKYINFQTLYRCKQFFFDKLVEKNFKLHILLGNHDVFFKNTNEVNSPELLLREYPNITVYKTPTDVEFDGTKIAIAPWICTGNFQDSMDYLKNTSAQILLGHLEIIGFEMYRGSVNDHGFERNIFDKFDIVMTGHFHHRSTKSNIHYLGIPYELTWSDWNDPKGFHVFDTDTRELEFIENPHKMFHKVHYDDSQGDMDSVLSIDPEPYKNTFVKVIVHNKNNPYWFDLFTTKIEKAGVIDLQVVEDHLNLNLEDDSDITEDAEDTLTILRKYCDQIDITSTNVNKNKLDAFLTDLYQEALHQE